MARDGLNMATLKRKPHLENPMAVYTSADNFGSANTTPGCSWKLVWRYTYGDVAVAGFPSYESAMAYNERHYTDPSATNNIGLLCHVEKGEKWEKIYRDEAGHVIGK